MEKKHIRRMKRSRKVCPIDSMDIEWDYQTESLDFAETYYRDVPVMAYGVPKEEASFILEVEKKESKKQ